MKYIHNLSGQLKNYAGVDISDNQVYQIPDEVDIKYYKSDQLLADIGSGIVKISINGIDIDYSVSEQIDILKNETIGETRNMSYPFANKSVDGKKLYSRVTGKDFTITTGTNMLAFTIPYPHVKINGTEIMGCDLGDRLNFKVLDSTTGSYTTVPNFELNVFGIDVCMPDGKYERLSNYDADLYQGMQVCIEYNSISDKTVYINYIIHELKD